MGWSTAVPRAPWQPLVLPNRASMCNAHPKKYIIRAIMITIGSLSELRRVKYEPERQLRSPLGELTSMTGGIK